MREATELVRLYASELEADLAFRGQNIADWHQGTRDAHGRMVLSSRKLLTLVAYLDDESALRRYAEWPFGRGGRWSDQMQVLKHHANETAKLLASYEVVHTGRMFEPDLVLEPLEKRAIAEHEHFVDDAMDDVAAQLRGD